MDGKSSIGQTTNPSQFPQNLKNQVTALIDSEDFTKAFQILQSASPKDRWAQRKLGFLHYRGLGTPRDFTMAMKHYQKAADQGCITSLSSMGFLHFLGQGQGTPQDYQQALRCFEKASEKNDAFGLYGMGLLYSLGLVDRTLDYRKAIDCFKAATNKHHGSSWYKLGITYRYGHDVTKDESLAQHCFNKAVEHGLSPNAKSVEEYQQAKLTEALAYLDKQEYPAAFVSLLSLAYDHNETAQHQLVQMCLDGHVTDEHNLPIAISILKKAHAEGNPKAAFMAGKLTTQLPFPLWIGRSDIINDALKWFKKSAVGENGADNCAGEAYYQMARLSKEENIDLEKIPVYLEKAHYQDHLTAAQYMNNLCAHFLMLGPFNNVSKAFSSAVARIQQNKSEQALKVKLQSDMEKKLQDQQMLETSFKLAMTRLETSSSPEDLFNDAQSFIESDRPDYALPFLEALEKNNHAKAQSLLGQMHMDGRGMAAINLDKAITCFKNAFDLGYEEAGFFLVDCYLMQSSFGNQSNLALAKEVLERMVSDHLIRDKGVDVSKVNALLAPKPTIFGIARDWYEIKPLYLKVALKMAKIHYIENPSSGKNMSALAQEIMLTANKETQFELIEWYLTRSESDQDKDAATHFLHSINVTKVPDAYPKTQALKK